VGKRAEYEVLLAKYGYDGNTYPSKQYIITETNIPSIASGDNIGSEEAQRNYLTKLIIAAQKENLLSVHTFSLYDDKPAATASDPYHSMGFYTNLDNIIPYSQTEKPSVIACRTMMKYLDGASYNKSKTEELALTAEIEGAAFDLADGSNVFVLWAKTSVDNDESANAVYTFPHQVNSTIYTVTAWDGKQISSSGSIALTGSPVIITINSQKTATVIESENIVSFNILPVPSLNSITINGPQKPMQVIVQNSIGTTVLDIIPESWPLTLDISSFTSGIYTVTCEYGNMIETGTFAKQ